MTKRTRTYQSDSEPSLVGTDEVEGSTLEVHIVGVVLDVVLGDGVRSDRAETIQRLRKMTVKERPEHRVDPLNLTSASTIVLLEVSVPEEDNDDGDEKVREEDGDQDSGAEDVCNRHDTCKQRGPGASA